MSALVSNAADWQYTVRPGDDMWSIVKRYCGDMSYLQAIASHNNLVDSNGIISIRAGQRIAIPTEYLAFAPSQAQVRAVNGLVRIQQCLNCASPQIRAKGGEALFMNYVLITADNGAALIEFADGSLLAVQRDSRIIFDKLTAFGPAGMVDTHLRFVHGRGRALIQTQSLYGGFRISTPEGIAAVRGTQFRVGYEADTSTASTETLEGAVNFTRNTQATDLPAGFGVSASPAGVIKESLLAAPSGLAGHASIGQQQTISWQPLAGASAYISEWASQAEPDVILTSATHVTTELTVDVHPGPYVLRVRGVSAAGIEGYDASLPLQVLALAPTSQTAEHTGTGATRFTWDFPQPDAEFSLTITPEHDAPAQIITARGLSTQTILAPGRYRWQVTATDSAASPELPLTILPTEPQGLSVVRDGKVARISWAADREHQYVLMLRHISRDELLVEEAISGDNHQVDLPYLGRYEIELASRINGVQSPTTSTNITRAWPAWWLLMALPILAF
ncbi:MAG: FecR domain-containing protein [Pseudomonadota bacterium]